MKNEKSIQIQSSISPQQQTLHYSKANFREQGAEIIADTVRKKLHAECKSVLQIKYMHLNINVTPWRITLERERSKGCASIGLYNWKWLKWTN